MYGKPGKTPPIDFYWRFTRMRLFKMTGRPLEEIDALSAQDVDDIFGYWIGESKANRENRR